MLRQKKRLWAMLLSVALVVTQLPAVAMAETAVPEDGAIQSFAALDSGVANQTVPVGTLESELDLPEELTATVYHVTEDTIIPDEDITEDDDVSTASPSDAKSSVSGNNTGDNEETTTIVTTSKEQIPVTWESSPAYDGDTADRYVFTANVDGYILSSGVELPQITVMVGEIVIENPGETQPEKPVPCTKTEGCILLDGHEGSCETENALLLTIINWTFVDDENLNEGVLPLLTVSKDNQADYETVVSMLPTQIQAELQAEEEQAVIDIADWLCPDYQKDEDGNWPFTGDYTFTAVLPEGYVIAPDVEIPHVTVIVGTDAAFLGLVDSSLYTIDAQADWDGLQTWLNDTASQNAVVRINTAAGASISEYTLTVPNKNITIESTLGAETPLTNLLLRSDEAVTLTIKNLTVSFTPTTVTDGVIFLASGSTLQFAGTSSLKVKGDTARTPAIHVPSTHSLTLSGVDAQSSLSAESQTLGAGIGARGLASGNGESAGTITITRGQVTATGDNGAGIGGGYGGATGGNGGNIKITGGQVTAMAASGASIGGGYGGSTGGNGGNIEISGEDTVVKAIKKSQRDTGTGIGGGGGITGGNGGTVKIIGGHVDAAGFLSASIGGGLGAADNGSLTASEGAVLTLYGADTNATTDYKNCTVIDKDGNSAQYDESGQEILPNAVINIDTVAAGDFGYTFSDGVVTITKAGSYTIQNQNPSVPTTNRIVVKEGLTDVYITLGGVNIDVSGIAKACAFSISNNAVVEVTLAGNSENSLKSGLGRAGLEVPESAELTIKGNGRLTAVGGNGNNDTGGSAGIGGAGGDANSFHAGGTGGKITLSGSAFVEAVGGKVVGGASGLGGSGIGGGGGSAYGGIGGEIIIEENARVRATGGNDGSGIGGGGDDGSGGSITIQGDAQVEATGGITGAGIGGGSNGNSGTILVSGNAWVKANGSDWAAAGIGGGRYGKAENITIEGNAVVLAAGKEPIGDGPLAATAGALPKKNSGVILEGAVDTNMKGSLYGDVTLSHDTEIPTGCTLTIPEGKTLTIGAGVTLTIRGTLHNNGTIINNGTILCLGTFTGNEPTGGTFHRLSVTPPSHTFAEAEEGAAVPEALTVTVKNTGNQPTGVLTISISTTDFVVSPTSLNIVSGNEATFTIQPAAGLSVGPHTATVVVSMGDVAFAKVQVDFTVTTKTPVGEAPQIIVQPGNQNVQEGQTAVFAVNASGSKHLSYQWQVNKDGGTTWGDVSEGTGGTSASYTTGQTTSAMNGWKYRCVVRNDAGNVISDAAMLVVESRYSGSNEGGSSSGAVSSKDSYKITGDRINQSITRYDLQRLADSSKSLTMNCDTVSMILEPAALKAVLAVVPATAGSIIFTASPTDLQAFPGAAALIGSHLAYDFTISYKDDKGNNVPLKVNFPAGSSSIAMNSTTAANEVMGNLFMVYVDGSGTVTWLDKSSCNNGRVLADVPHFSIYGVAYKASAPVFVDIAEHWAKADIEFVAARGLLASTGGGRFSPDANMTRGMFVTALGRLAGVNPETYAARSFTDVKADAYYAPYVEWAVQKNIVKGTGEGLFSPDEPVTRELMAVIMSGYAGQMGYSIPTALAGTTFTDSSQISAWATKEVTAMQRAGVIKGKAGNQFDPQAGATRAEVSALLHRFVEVIIDPATAQGWRQNDSGQWFYYENGKPVIGWKQLGGKWYYLDQTGLMQYDGWKQINGKWYYFYKDGSMAVNTKIDDYEVGSDGARNS